MLIFFTIPFIVYNIMHLLCRRFCGSGLKTARTASSNTCFSPRCVRAEHSIYFTARICDIYCHILLLHYSSTKNCVGCTFLQTLFANFCPCSRLIALRPCSAKAVSVSRSSRKSILVPTSIIGASGQ